MSQTVEEMRYQLEDWLAQGFTSTEERANYQALKEASLLFSNIHLILTYELNAITNHRLVWFV